MPIFADKPPRSRARRRVFVAGSAAALSVSSALFQAHAQTALVFTAPKQMRDQSKELAMKIRQPFTVVTVGDMIQMVPISNSNDPDIQYWVRLMRDADVTLANNENTVVDHDTFAGPICHMEAPAWVADDWKNMGIDMMTKANNHTWDCGDEGVKQDFHELTRVGIVHVGVDRNLTEARMARTVATPKGTVGMVGMYADNGNELIGLPTRDAVSVTTEQLTQLRAMRASILARRGEVENPVQAENDPPGQVTVFGVLFKTGSDATGDSASNSLKARMAEAQTRKGVIETKSNKLELVTYNGVTAAQMAQLRAIAGDRGQGDTLSAFGTRFRVMPGPGEYSYEMDSQVERAILREIRTGKQFNDFQAATIHWHQNRYAFQAYSFDHYPAAFEVKFAHDAIDQGADLFFAHGVHTLKGIEIYKGKPIFYGQSNFVFQEQIFRSWRDRGAQQPVSESGPIVGDGEENEKAWNWLEQPANMESYLASSHYEAGRLTEIRIYPVTLGSIDRVGSQYGTPRKPSSEEAGRILQHIVEYSKPFGTKISIENGVGVIRLDS